MYPKARRDVLESELRSERVVYDLDKHAAFALNDVAGDVWRRCDGATSVESIAESMSAERGADVDPAVVALAVERLGSAGLLEDAHADPALSRRAALAKLGAATAALVPVVTALAVPTPAMATSPHTPPPPPPPPPPPMVCVGTPGYWQNTQNHPWPSPYSPSASFLGSSQTWHQVLRSSVAGYTFYSLAQHFIAATLNVQQAQLSGVAAPTSVLTALAAAETLLRKYISPSGEILRVPKGSPDRATMLALKDVLAAFNEGAVSGFPHC